MDRTIVECLIPAAPCSECEERDCCRDERRVEQLRARVAELEPRAAALESCQRARRAAEERVAELERDLADADQNRARRCNELIRDSNDYARMMEQRINAAESRASAAEQRVAELEARLQFDPSGSDKIDELEQAIQFLRHELDVARTELGLKRSDCVRLGMDCDALKSEKRAAEQRVDEVEAALDKEKKQSAFYDLQAQRIMIQRNAAESRASAAVEAHSALLSRIAADGTLDAMERAVAAEQRAAVLEQERDSEAERAVEAEAEVKRLIASHDAAVPKMRGLTDRVKQLEGALRLVHPERVAPERGNDPPECLECGEDYLLLDGADPSAECDSCVQNLLSAVRDAARAALAASETEGQP